MKLKIATSQFSVSSNIEQNFRYISKQMEEAADLDCDVIHFPEGSLSGYAGADFKSFENFDWKGLKKRTYEIMYHAKELHIWVILGSAHPLSEPHKPHNSNYIINNTGEIEDRYDKLFCAGNQLGTTDDLAHYSSGNHFSIFEINGVKCSTLICHDYRYPELYRELKKENVVVIFHSFHAGNMDEEKQTFMESQVGKAYHNLNPGKTYPEITMPASMISYAANNYVWISCSNTSAKESCWASNAVRPDGIIIGKLEKNIEGLLITEIDTKIQYYDSTLYWRKRAIEGVYYSGEKVNDLRSDSRKKL